jgi:exonuclease SbcC
MRLNRLVLTDFLSHEQTDLDLSAVAQVVVTGPVGAGKSALIEALTWALYGEARGAVLDSVIRDGAAECAVRVEFATGAHGVVVARTKSRGHDSTLALEVDGEPRTRHTLRETMAEVVRLVGLGYPAALAGPLMLQADTGALMRLRPAERKEVLLGLFGLERFEAWEAAAKEKRDNAALSARSAQTMLDIIGNVDAAIEANDAGLEALRPRIETLTEAVLLGRERVEALATRTAGLRERTGRALDLNSQLEALRARFKAAKEDSHLTTAALLNAENVLKGIEVHAAVDPAEVETAEEASRQANRAHANAYGALATAQAHAEHLANVNEVTCPECKAVFRPGVAPRDIKAAAKALDTATEAEAAAARAKVEAEAAMKAVRAREQAWLKAAQAEAKAKAEIARLRERIKGEAKLLGEMAEQGNRLKAELAGLESAGPELTAALDELDSARGALANNEADLRQAEADAVTLATEQEKRKAERVRRDQLAKELAAATADAQVHALLAKAFHRDGIPTLMLESSLPLIEQRANEVLGRMPGDFAVRLITQRQTSGLKAQERLDVVVEVGGVERDYENLSGGQKFRVDLALRLGLTRALAGRSFDTLIFDESLDRYQDNAGREALLESLATVSADFGLVFAISHHPDVIERFGNRIEVAMEDGVSVAAPA